MLLSHCLINLSQTVAGVIVAPLVVLFILLPYLKWRKEGRVPVSENIEKSTVPKDRKPVRLSVIVPAYNETERLPAMLNEAIAYLTDRRNNEPNYTWEMIVVDDHSRDSTYDLATSFNTFATPIYAIRLKKNAGKGGAVKMGALHAVGEYILMVDADGATRFSDIQKLEEVYDPASGIEIVFGSRDHLKRSENVKKRNPIRNFLMACFHVAVLLIIGTDIKDTQCGFKIFSKRTSDILFKSLHLERWAFDTEIVLLSNILGFKVREIDVNWTEIPGSKLNVVIASIQMLRDMVLLRVLYLIGIWKPALGNCQ